MGEPFQEYIDVQNAGFKFHLDAQGARLKKMRTENERLRATADKLRKISVEGMQEADAEVAQYRGEPSDDND